MSAEVLHTIHDSPNHHCNKLFDVLEEDNYGIIEEIFNCEKSHNDKCVKDQPFNNQPFECLKELNQILFNDNFDAITYGYSQNKVSLMKFLGNNIALTTLDDPDFLSLILFNEFFTAEMFKVFLESLTSNQFIMDQKIAILNTMFAELNLRARIVTEEKDLKEIQKAGDMLRCKMYDQFLRVYYALAFSLNGKVQFERLHVDMFNLVSQPIVDRFLQVKDNNTFVYLGPLREEPKRQPDEDDEDYEERIRQEKQQAAKEGPKFTNKPLAKTIPIPFDELNLFVAQVVDNLYTPQKKKTVNIEKVLARFEEIIAEQEVFRQSIKNKPVYTILKETADPILFGTDKFEGLRYILDKIRDYKCPNIEINRFKGKVLTQTKFFEEEQRYKLVAILDSYLNPVNNEAKPEEQAEEVKKQDL
eukprot:403373840